MTITVFASSNAVSVISAKLLLEGEQIPFVTVGELVQDMMGFGRVSGGFNPLAGPVQLRVTEEDAPRALEALKELKEAGDP